MTRDGSGLIGHFVSHVPTEIGTPTFVRICVVLSDLEDIDSEIAELIGFATAVIGEDRAQLIIARNAASISASLVFARGSALIVVCTGPHNLLAELLVTGTRGIIEGEGLTLPTGGGSRMIDAVRRALAVADGDSWGLATIGGEE